MNLGRLHELREEARKGWEHTISDEIVYFQQNGVNDGLIEAGHFYQQGYRSGRLWLEVFCRLTGGGVDGEYAAICEADLGGAFAERDIGHRNPRSVDGNGPVLVGVVQDGNHPERVRSVVRLEAFDDLSSLWTDVGGLLSESRLVHVLKQREGSISAGLSGFSNRGEVFNGESVRDVIQRTSHVVDRIANDHRPRTDSGRLKRLVAQLCAAIRIGVTATGFVFAPVKGSLVRVQQIQVAFRPMELKPGAVEWMHSRQG